MMNIQVETASPKNVSQLLCEDKRQCFVLGSQKVFVSLEKTLILMSLLSVVIADIKIEEKYDATRDDLISTGIHVIARNMVSANRC